MAGIVSMLLFMHREAKKLNIRQESLTWPINMKEKKILFITDLHNRKIDQDMFKEIPKVDFVIIGGDLSEPGMDSSLLDHNLSILSSFGRTLFVWGNNDYDYGEEKLNFKLKKHGIQALNNQSLVVKEGLDFWTIAGVDDLGHERTDVDLALTCAKGPILLVSHNPEVANILTDQHRNVEVIFAGHTHGGQIRLGPLSIAEKGGWRVKNHIPVLISNGFGTTRIPARLGAVPEIHLITIQGKEY